MKRFYKIVSTLEMPGGLAIALDGKLVKTPSGAILCTRYEGLADAMMREWAVQGEQIIPDSMKMTQLLSTQIDRVGAQRPSMRAALLKYTDTDLICYYADHPPALAERQRAIWGPVQAWFEERFGVTLKTTDSLQALCQPPELHAAMAAYIDGLDDPRFTVFQLVVPLAGSLVLGAAFLEGEIAVPQVFAAMRIEEDFKAEIYDEEKYGLDSAEAKRNEAARADLDAAAAFLSFVTE